MPVTPEHKECVQLELPVDVLCRLLRERNLVASEFRSLNGHSNRASWRAIKQSLIPAGNVAAKEGG